MIDDLTQYLGNPRNRDDVLTFLLVHVRLALLPLLVGLLVAVPIGFAAHRVRKLRALVLGASNVLYTVPSLALFVILPPLLGTRILDEINVVAALTLYTAALLVRPVVDALDALPQAVLAAATAIGYGPTRRFLTVELPLAVPVLTAGVRVASVSNISLVSVGALIGVGGLGQLFTQGFTGVPNTAPIIVGIVLTLALALVVDLLLIGVRELLTPWQRAGRTRSRRSRAAAPAGDPTTRPADGAVPASAPPADAASREVVG